MTAHEKAVGATVEWYTPRSLFDALGTRFDLDPASAPGDCVPADTTYTKQYDGLAHKWSGHVWLNPPYGPAAVPFIDCMIVHGDGLMLLPSRTETAAYQRALAAADLVCFLRDRLWFVRSDGYTGRSSFGSTLFAFGPWAADALRRADLGWTVAPAKHPDAEPLRFSLQCWGCGQSMGAPGSDSSEHECPKTQLKIQWKLGWESANTASSGR